MKNRLFFLLIFLFCFSSSAFSQITFNITLYVETNSEAQASISSLCPGAQWQGTYQAASPSSDPHYHNGYQTLCYKNGNWNGQRGQVFWRDTACEVPKKVNPATGACETPCTAGQSSSASFYRGDFSISTEAGVFVGTAGPRPSTLCDGQCTGTVVGDPWDVCESDAYASPSSPSAVSCTATISLTGSSCTGGNGNAPIYTAPSTPGTNPGDSGATDETGASSNAGTNNGTCANGATNYPTCTTENQAGTNGASCGGENEPPCRYAVDENGVVTGVDRTPGELGASAYKEDRETAFEANVNRTEIPWSWNFNIPSEACHPLDWSVLGNIHTYDPCPLLVRVRTALGYMYFFLCCFYLWSRVTNATGGVK